MFPVARSSVPLRLAGRLITARSFSACARVSNAHAHEHGHEHDHHGHHGPELAPAENLLNKNVLYLIGVSVATLAAYGANQSWEKSHDKSLLQSLLGSQNSVTDVTDANKEFATRVSSTQKLFQSLQLNQPEKKFHEFAAERIIPFGPERSLVPGTVLKPEEIGPRRERTKFLKDL